MVFSSMTCGAGASRPSLSSSIATRRRCCELLGSTWEARRRPRMSSRRPGSPFRGVDRFDGRSTLKTWLFRILTNRAKTAGQREGRTIVLAELAGCGAPGHGSQVVADGSLDRSSSWAPPPEHLHRPAEDHVLATRSSPSCRRRHRRVAARAASGHHPPRRRLLERPRGLCRPRSVGHQSTGPAPSRPSPGAPSTGELLRRRTDRELIAESRLIGVAAMPASPRSRFWRTRRAPGTRRARSAARRRAACRRVGWRRPARSIPVPSAWGWRPDRSVRRCPRA